MKNNLTSIKLTAIIEKIKNYAIYLVAYVIVSTQSFMMRIKVFGKSPKVHFEQSYQGQKILLLALYQKGRLRPDIENLLITAKQLGMYVLAINTLKVLDPNSLKEKIDCYIELPNFGRDFGSYKKGFLHLFKKGWEKQCPRLLILNDSLFYSKQNLAAFLNQMMNTDIEVLGATENHEIEHHLGMPIIKLDGLYRGMFSIADVVQLTSQLSQNEKLSFQKLMFDKPFGGNTLSGWKCAAFYQGLI